MAVKVVTETPTNNSMEDIMTKQTTTNTTIESDSSDESTSNNSGSDMNGTTTTATSSKTTTTKKGDSLDNLNYYDNGKGKSLKDRSSIPNSFYVVAATTIGLQYSSNMYSQSTLDSYTTSMTTSCIALQRMIQYGKDILFNSTTTSTTTDELVRVCIIGSCLLFLLYVFFIAPFRAGFWTGKRTRKATLHRYMGLVYLITYVAAWIEYFTNYNPNSYLCHFIACNGIIQGMSAYISFRVLPELSDPGYYSDKAVLSRVFIHENIFFTLLSIWGSTYYIHTARTALQHHPLGKFIEHIYIFWPYIVIRPWFPITSFSNAGTTYKGRTDTYETFYKYGTLSVKIFYLWAKYFFGFFINFSVYLDLLTPYQWKLLHGMILLNAGTVSLSVFLHTLRFKKVLPPLLTFSVYLVQIYLSFLAIPTAFEMFLSHPKLCAVCISGLVLNMTRSRTVHALWCLACYILLDHSGIDW